MNLAEKAVEIHIEMHKAALSENNFIELILLEPRRNVLDLIKDNGGKIGQSHWDQWCLSAGQTCKCQSHDPGQSSQTVQIPAAWQLKEFKLSELSSIFDFVDDNESNFPLFIIPAKTETVSELVLIYASQYQHYAGSTYPAKLRD